MTTPLLAVRMMGAGAALPEHRVTNADMVKKLARLGVETSDEWIRERTGIENRYFVADGTLTSDLAVTASLQALESAKINRQDIGLIIVATSTPDMVFPSTACIVQRKLGVPPCPAFDVQAVCSGFVYALSIAQALMLAQNIKHALVIGAETFSSLMDWQDRSTCVLFGDGAGAVVLSAMPATSPAQGILASELGADGRHQKILCAPGQVRHGEVVGDPFLRMEGQAVFKFAVNIISECAEKILQQCHLTADDLHWLIPHQANKRIMAGVAKKLHLPEHKVISWVHEHANTSAASIPLALATSQHSLKTGETLLMLGVGGGFTWGGVLTTWR